MCVCMCVCMCMCVACVAGVWLKKIVQGSAQVIVIYINR